MFARHFSTVLILMIFVSSVLSAENSYQEPIKNTLVARLMGHRRMPTEIRDHIHHVSNELASGSITEIESEVNNAIDKAIHIKYSLDLMGDDDLGLENLYPYDETIQNLTACYIAMVAAFERNNQYENNENSRTLLSNTRDLIAQYMYLSEKHEYRLFNAYFMNDKGLDLERCRQVWLDHNPSAISILFEGAKTYDEFTKRLFGAPIHNFITLIRKCKSHDIQPIFQQGWKLHVSATFDSALTVASIVLPLLAKKNVAHKIVGSVAFFDRLNQDQIQQGKFITVYPENDLQAVQIATLINSNLSSSGLRPKDFIRVPGELQLGKTGGLSARYGAFAGHLIAVLDENGDPVSENGKIKMILDNRRDKIMPDFIKSHPFGKLVRSPLVRRDAQKQITSPNISKKC